jgi:hypothetical protein
MSSKIATMKAVGSSLAFLLFFHPAILFRLDTYLRRGVTVLAELWTPRTFYVRFRDSKFLESGIVSPTPNPQHGGPGYLS